MLAEFYGRGLATKQDLEMTSRVLRRAAELGNVEAARSTYVLMMYGPAQGRDSRLAMHFLNKAAKANDARATYLFAREYLRGANVPNDPAIAAHWLQRSSEAGNALASLWLSELHFKGLGVARDLTRAEKLLSDALAQVSIQEKNQFAWELSVGTDERLRDGALAIRVLEPALAAVTEKVTAHVDTLAAAYAEVRQFDKAVVTQLSAIDRAQGERRPQEMISGMEDRLRLYQRGEPYREVAP
jgi:TPR repeat protein